MPHLAYAFVRRTACRSHDRSDQDLKLVEALGSRHAAVSAIQSNGAIEQSSGAIEMGGRDGG
jgi:hypothetical protein